MSDAADDAAVVEVKVSADGEDWRDISPPVQFADVEDHDRLTDRAKVILDDPAGVLAHASFEGLEIRVGLGWNAENATIFEGVVTAPRAVTSGDGARVELTCLDFTYRMSRHTPDPPMQWNRGERLSDVIRSIVTGREYGLTVAQIEPINDVTYDEDTVLRQANQDDWSFVQALAERHNCLAFVEFDGSDESRFYFVPIERVATAEPVGILSRCLGSGDLIRFSYERISSGALVQRTTTATNPVTGETVSQEASAPVPQEVPAPSVGRNTDVSASRRAALEALTELSATALAQQRADRRRVAGRADNPAVVGDRVVADPTRLLGYRGTGAATGTVMLRAKSRVTIGGVAPWADGDWYLTKVNHVYTRERINRRLHTSYVSTFTATR